MSTPSPLLIAAAPSLISAIQAIKQFNADMGPDPLKWALNYPGAQLKLVGSVDLLLPGLAVSEGAVLQNTLNQKADSWISSLQQIQAQAAAPAAMAVAK